MEQFWLWKWTVMHAAETVPLQDPIKIPRSNLLPMKLTAIWLAVFNTSETLLLRPENLDKAREGCKITPLNP